MRRAVSITKSGAFRLMVGLVGIAIIGYVDRRLSEAIPLALLYLAPVVLMSTVLRRWQIPLLGVLCTVVVEFADGYPWTCLLYTSPSPRDRQKSRMPSS